VLILHDMGKTGQYLARVYHGLGYNVTLGFLNTQDAEEIVPMDFEIQRTIIGANSTFELIVRTRPHARSVDFLHCNFCFSSVIAGYFGKWIDGKRYIAHARGGDIKYNVARARAYKWFGFLVKQAIKKADLFFVSTPDLLTVGKLIREDVVWLPNPIDLENFRPMKPKIDLHQGFDYTIFMPSRIDFRMKGTDLVIEQFSLLPPNFALHIIKHGVPKDIHRLLKLIEKLDLKNRVFIHDRLPRKDVTQLYNAADMIIDQFGGAQAFGNVTLEGLACEKTVITDYDGAVYPEKPPVTAISIDELAETVIKLTQDSQLRNPRGREWMLKYHSFRRAIEILGNELKRAGFS